MCSRLFENYFRIFFSSFEFWTFLNHKIEMLSFTGGFKLKKNKTTHLTLSRASRPHQHESVSHYCRLIQLYDLEYKRCKQNIVTILKVRCNTGIRKLSIDILFFSVIYNRQSCEQKCLCEFESWMC